MADQTIDTLYHCIKDAVSKASSNDTSDRAELAAAEFSKNWIYEHSHQMPEIEDSAEASKVRFSGSLFILFSKNGSVTNLQFLELNAMLSMHCYVGDSAEKIRPIIYSTPSYKSFLYQIFSSVRLDGYGEGAPRTKRIEDTAHHIVKTYGGQLSNSMVVDLYYTSCAIHAPQSLHIDLWSIVNGSGYVHSAGPLVYLRNLEKVSELELRAQLNYRAEQVPDRIQLVPYADEYFEKWESGVTSTRNGLDGTRIKAKKHYIEHSPLEEFLLNIVGSDDSDKLVVAPGVERFRQEREKAIIKDGCLKTQSLWLLTDRNFEYRSDARRIEGGQSVYLISYHQFYINEYPFHLIKERKPGWVQSVTLPHTVSLALLNIAQENLRLPTRNEPLMVVDPFVGSGTILFDALIKWPTNMNFFGIDKDPLAVAAIKANADFIALKRGEIDTLCDQVSAFLSRLENVSDVLQLCELSDTLGGPVANAVSGSIDVLAPGLANGAASLSELKVCLSGSMPEELVDGDARVEVRCIQYAVWRALKLGRYAVEKNGFDHMVHLLRDEFGRIVKEFSSFNKSTHHEADGAVKHGLYSTSLSVHHRDFLRVANEVNQPTGFLSIVVGDAVEELKKHDDMSIDLLITDPPYGFNVSIQDKRVFSQLYDDLFGLIIQKMKRQGQFIICLPSKPKTGQSIDFALTRRVAISNILLKAQIGNRRLIRVSNSRIKAGDIDDAPYYWGGNTAISRDILHFTID